MIDLTQWFHLCISNSDGAARYAIAIAWPTAHEELLQKITSPGESMVTLEVIDEDGQPLDLEEDEARDILEQVIEKIMTNQLEFEEEQEDDS